MYMSLKFAFFQTSCLSNVKLEIPELKGGNYKVWRERVLLYLGCMDIYYAIRKDEPSAISATSTKAEIKLYDKWERYNCLSIMFIKTHISVGIRGSIEKHEKVRDLIKAIDEQFAKSKKSLTNTLTIQFSTLRLTGVCGVHDHIMHMMDIAS